LHTTTVGVVTYYPWAWRHCCTLAHAEALQPLIAQNFLPLNEAGRLITVFKKIPSPPPTAARKILSYLLNPTSSRTKHNNIIVI
jgi:hypothetical protein